MCVFTSCPMPKQNTRTLPRLARVTFATMSSSFVLPTVGKPSVRKMMMYGRSPFSGRNASAFFNASSMAVPPSGFRSLMNVCAFARLSFATSIILSKSGSTSVAKRSTSKRSPSFKFSTQNASAFFACSSFAPAIEPDVSSTNITSFGITFAFFASAPGDASSTK